ncbi:thermonuclease family protein [Oricola sp.]|uniref:thermonuclease family protein n=1 Tax=Oricola sp. TaxID=1979950 RepID=UPI0025CCC616|nr:thermonuclease family protein [Oricola sp.]MCI5077318.1 thermonuclease family protein [Oricola sp.]
MIALFALVAVAAAVLDEMSMRTLSGPARVVDGDTLALGGERVRLAGIDAPEHDQTCRRDGVEYACGRASREYLATLVGGGDISCRGNERDRYGRLLARCVAGNVELAAAMVLAGWAVSADGYAQEQREARRQSAGIWAGSFMPPAEWRASRGGTADIGAAGMAERLLQRLRSLFGSRGQGGDA